MYDSNFRLSWDNDIPFHVAEHVTHLRNFRGQSQATLAKAMGTSQSAIARIEGGDENITLSTLKRLIDALSGRLRLAIEPAEANLPRWPHWWQMITSGLNAANPYILHGAAGRVDMGGGRQIVAGWTSHNFTSTGTTPQISLTAAEAK